MKKSSSNETLRLTSTFKLYDYPKNTPVFPPKILCNRKKETNVEEIDEIQKLFLTENYLAHCIFFDFSTKLPPLFYAMLIFD